MVASVSPAPPDGENAQPQQPPPGKQAQSTLQLDDPGNSAIDPLLQKCAPLNRLFLRRHPLNNKRFDIMDEDGIDLYQLVDCSEGSPTPINYILKDAPTDVQLLSFTGTTSFLGLKGEIVANYSAPKSVVPIGTVKQSTSRCCSLTPKCVIHNGEGTAQYDLKDNDQTSILWPGRSRHAPDLDIRQHGVHLPVALGHIGERRLVVNEAVRRKGSYSNARRSMPAVLPVTSPNARLGGGRLSLTPVVVAEVNDNQDMRRASLRSTGSGRSVKISHSTTEVTERPTHDHFCIAFKHSMDYKMKIMMIGAHLLVNHDLVRRDRRCTRGRWGIVFIIFLGLAILGVVATIVSCVLLL